MSFSHAFKLILAAGFFSQISIASPVMIFTGLGDLPGGKYFSQAYDISDDGLVVVGRSVNSNGLVAFRWTAADEMQALEDIGASHVSAAYACSSNGSVIVGYVHSDKETSDAYRWTEATGMEILIDLKPSEFSSSAFGVSGDGSVVVGNVNTKKDSKAFYWKSGSSDYLKGGVGYANDVSENGSVVAVNSYFRDEFKAYIWTEKDNEIEWLGCLAGGGNRSVTGAVSPDGSVVVGHSDSASGTKAFLWKNKKGKRTGMTSLGDLQGGFSMATDVSNEGACVVGFTEGSDGITAFVWDAENGMRSLKEVLISGQADNVIGWRLLHAEGISSDGSTIVGYGINPDDELEAFVAVIH